MLRLLCVIAAVLAPAALSPQERESPRVRQTPRERPSPATLFRSVGAAPRPPSGRINPVVVTFSGAPWWARGAKEPFQVSVFDYLRDRPVPAQVEVALVSPRD